MHNIEKSAFRKGEYIGYGGGDVWRIVKNGSTWRATPRKDVNLREFSASTLKELSAGLESLTSPARKANPAKRRAPLPKTFGAMTKRQLQDFIAGCHNSRDYGPDFTAACNELNSRPVAARKANPAPRKRAISRPSQVTKKAPSKRLVSRRKLAAKKPVKGYFPNPVAITAPGPSRKTHEDLPHLFPQPGGAYMISFWRESTKKWVPATLEYSITAAKKWLEYQGYKKAVLLK